MVSSVTRVAAVESPLTERSGTLSSTLNSTGSVFGALADPAKLTGAG